MRFVLVGGASTTTSRAPRGASAKPSLVASMPATPSSALRKRPISTRSRARCDSSAFLARNARASSVAARRVVGPRLGQRAGQREQNRTRLERNRLPDAAHSVTAGVDDERLRCKQRFDFVERAEAARRALISRAAGASSSAGRALDLGGERRDARPARGATSACAQRGARRVDPQTPHRDAGDESSS